MAMNITELLALQKMSASMKSDAVLTNININVAKSIEEEQVFDAMKRWSARYKTALDDDTVSKDANGNPASLETWVKEMKALSVLILG